MNKKKKSPFDIDTNARITEMFWENIRAQVRIMDGAKWEGFFKTVVTLNKTNKPAIDAKELRVIYDIICDEEEKRRGINIIKTTRIEDMDLMYTMKDDKRIYILNTENICRVLRKHSGLAGKFRYDTFVNTFEIRDNMVWRTQEDHDVIDVQTFISKELPALARVSKSMVQDAIMKISKECVVDTAREYMENLTWDGVGRLDQWLMHTYGVEDNEYHRKVGSNWLKGLVKRIMVPGCKFDYVLVLEGEQGAKKSTSLAVLGGHWHAETTMSTESKDFFMQFAGKAIIEFSEGETLSRTEVKRMKAIITMQSDRYRMPYERATLDFPRRCVFAMTTNQTEYLKDETGNRRWLPVSVALPEANIPWLEDNREQLFAEAYHRVVHLRETLYEFPKEDMMREQNARMIHDPNEDIISDWYHNECSTRAKEEGVSIQQVYTEVLHKFGPTKPMSRFDEMNISQVLQTLGLVKRRVAIGGARVTKYFPKVMSTPSELMEKIEKEEGQINIF